MGVMFDYFRAEDDEQAQATHLMPGGPLATDVAFDGVATKGIFPDPHLDQLVAHAAGVPYARQPRTNVHLWPPADTPPPVDETSLWLTDPSVERLATRLRDALAGVPDDSVGQLGERWAADISHTADQATSAIAALSALARRARDAGQELYCWSAL